MTRVKNNELYLKDLEKSIDDTAEPLSNNGMIARQLSIISSLLIDISVSLAVIADNGNIQNKKEPCDDASRFCKWVAGEIFDEDWDYNQDAFAEIACRKLEKMGIVKITDEKWELVESEDKE
jgi:hypothetical protein